MGVGWSGVELPVVWAQAAGANAPTTVSNAVALAGLALRRWCGSLTLSSSSSQPGLDGLWIWLSGLAVLLALAVAFQGPSRTVGQLFDVAGHVRVVSLAIGRVRRAGRLLAVAIGLTVVSWTGSQCVTFADPAGREDLLLLSKSRSLIELAVEHGLYAALTPLRDVAGLASNLALLSVATIVLFRATADAWGAATQAMEKPGSPLPPRISGWATVGWSCGALYILYRLVAIPAGSPDLPLNSPLIVESAVVPVVMLLADGVLLAWVLSELRDAGFPDDGSSDARLPLNDWLALMPAAALACLAALPARYGATAAFLTLFHLPASVNASPVGGAFRWALGPGLAVSQAAALSFAGLAGAVAWTRGSPVEAVRVYGRMLGAEGARLVVVFGLAGVVAGAAASTATTVVLALPAASWLLNAADSYAHFLTLPVGLWTLAALTELAERSLPEATLVPVEAPKSEALAVAKPVGA